jgi:type VI protein secretion system component Hcp
MDVAQLYMLALRPTGVPIVGESADDLFKGQVELESWSWSFQPEERPAGRRRGAGSSGAGQGGASPQASTARDAGRNLGNLSREFNPSELRNLREQRGREDRRLREMALDRNRQISRADFSSIDNLDRRIRALEEQQARVLRQAGGEAERAADSATEAAQSDSAADSTDSTPPGFEFSFSKRVDVATTQLLNCMKAGDQLPTVTLTMHQASSNTPWTLVITVTKMRLKNYQLKVDVGETMVDLKEDWTAEFDSFGYVYQNRPHAGVKSLTAGGAAQTAAKGATQATVRTFMMKRMFGL